MLTILHDRIFEDGRVVDVATAEGFEVTAPHGATCAMATYLIARGYDPELPVRVVRADPLLFGAPFEVGGLTLALAEKLDVFPATDRPPFSDAGEDETGAADEVPDNSAVGGGDR